MNICNYVHTMAAQGWECPKCHAVMAPMHPTCFYCKPVQTQTVTSGFASTSILGNVPIPRNFTG